jgi:hypothetical protein
MSLAKSLVMVSCQGMHIGVVLDQQNKYDV